MPPRVQAELDLALAFDESHRSGAILFFDEAHRLRIWESMFPSTAERDDELDFSQLACKLELSGGEIRNVVLAASYLAANEGQLITMSQLKQALMREQRKSGRVIDDKEFDAL